MFVALEVHDEKIRTGNKFITNLWFADDIEALAEEERAGNRGLSWKS
ncbi:MAG: hypothetical protein AB2693_00005 [Candidatus Thiodiazotropha sp.]